MVSTKKKKTTKKVSTKKKTKKKATKKRASVKGDVSSHGAGVSTYPALKRSGDGDGDVAAIFFNHDTFQSLIKKLDHDTVKELGIRLQTMAEATGKSNTKTLESVIRIGLGVVEYFWNPIIPTQEDPYDPEFEEAFQEQVSRGT